MSSDEGTCTAQRRFRRLAAPIVDRLWDVERVGFDRLPTSGPAILCPNHISFLDSVFLMTSAPRNISFVGKSEYLDSWKTKHLFPALGMIPVDRAGGVKAMAALDAAADVLARGELFGIFPEGTRSRSGDLGRGRTGAARLSLSSGVPIFPVGIVGTDEIQPPDAPLPVLGRSCRIEIGEPIDPADFRPLGSNHVASRAMIDALMGRIAEMTGQRYVDEYHRRPEPAAPAGNVGRLAPVVEFPLRARRRPSLPLAVGS